MEKNGIIVSPSSGSGDSTITFSAEVNEGIDYYEIFTISTPQKLQQDIKVTRLGRREVFTCTDGDFILSDGGTFNVLKNGL